MQVQSIAIRLGAPAYPGDELVFTGSVAEADEEVVVIDVVGNVSIGAHVTGQVVIR